MLSAHFDSWDGSSGATDNGTGTITMMEALRILKAAYPNPKRTILVGHWSGEEQGLNGSRAFSEDHPEVVNGLQALFNQDNGTGRVAELRRVGPGQRRAVPREMDVADSDRNHPAHHPRRAGPSRRAADPTTRPSSVTARPDSGWARCGWEYGTYTWHTNRDTYDKVVADELKNNAVLTAMLAYLASEEPDKLPRERRVMPMSAQNPEQQSKWPECVKAVRKIADWSAIDGRTVGSQSD